MISLCAGAIVALIRSAELADLVHAMNWEIGLGSVGLVKAAARMPFRTAPPMLP